MKLNKKYFYSTITFTSFSLLVNLCLVTSMPKRFDVNGGFGHADEFDDDIPQLIEINKEDLIEINNNKPSKGKPKPDFALPSFSQFSSSSWNFGTSLGSHRPTMQGQKPPNSPNGPYHTPTASDTDELFLTQAQAGNSQAPSRPQPVVLQPMPILHDEPQSPPLFSQQQSLSSPSWTQPQQQSPPVFIQQPVHSPQVASPQSPSFLVQTPSASGQALSWSSSQAHMGAQAQTLSPTWSQSPPAPVAQQNSPQQQPALSSSPQILASSQQSSHSSKPFSLYEQLNLHLLEPQAWEKLQDLNKDQWHQLPQQQHNTYLNTPQQSQQQPQNTYLLNTPQQSQQQPQNIYHNTPQQSQQQPQNTYLLNTPQQSQQQPQNTYHNTPQQSQQQPHNTYHNTPQQSQEQPHNTFYNTPQQSQAQQFNPNAYTVPFNGIPYLLPPPPTMTNPIASASTTTNPYNNAENDNSNNVISAILNPVVDEIFDNDYTHPGHSPLSQYSNSDITVDDDKFFDNDDDFVSIDNDEDEIMKMVE